MARQNRGIQARVPGQPKRILIVSLGGADAVSARAQHNRNNRTNQAGTLTFSELCFQCLTQFGRQPMLPSSTSAIPS